MNEFLFAHLGSRLQTIIRRSKNPIAHRRAIILLEFMLGAKAEDLADRYAMPVAYLEQLITNFERHGIDTVYKGTRTKAYTMSPEERSLMVEMGRLTPRAFGIDRDIWLLSQLRNLALETNAVRVANLDCIRSALADAKLSYEDDLL